MELAGIIIVVIVVIVAATYFVFKSKVSFKISQMGSESKKQEIGNEKSSTIPKAEEREEKRSQPGAVIRELKTLDTKRYKANPMVERMLADRVERLEDELTKAREAVSGAIRQLSDLERKYAVLKEKYRSERIMEWIRNLAAVGMGIFGTLFFSKDPVQQGVGKLVTPFLAILFIITCVFSFLRKEKD